MTDYSMSIKVLCFLLLVLQYSNYNSCCNGAVMLSPSPRAFVCHAGERLEVTCNTTESTMQWRLTLMGMIDSVEISVSSTILHIPRARINSSWITVTRASERGETPLTSMLEINAINEVLNGTLHITCMEIEALPPISMETTTVYLVGLPIYPNSPLINIEKEFHMDGVAISLHWSQESHENLLVSYNVGIEPTIDATITVVSNTQANLSLAYNIPYNVTVVADFCGYQAATIIEINYVACRDILNEFPDNNISTVTVSGLGYSKPSLEGESVNFTCPSKWVLTGPNSTKCMGNREWEPDPREVMCKANCTPPLIPTGAYIIPYTSTLEGTVVTYICQKDQHLLEVTAVCSNNGLWEPNSSNNCAGAKLGQEGKIVVASSVTVFTVASIVFFTVGFLCRHWYPRNKAVRADSEISASENLTLGPLYDNILPNQHNSEVLELKQNIAYGPIQQLTSDTRTN